jgi:hypothetical protein
LKSSNENEGDFKVSGAKEWDEFMLALAETHGHALSKMQMTMYRAAVSHLTDEERTRGANWLLRNATFFPNPAECVQACTGIPAGSTATTASAVDATEANRLWAWMIRWLPWLVEGHRFTLTLGAYGEDPVSYEFVAGSLTKGLKKVADRKLRPLRVELRKAEARVQAYEHCELSHIEKRIARQEVPNSERDTIERLLQYRDPPRSDWIWQLPMTPEDETRIRTNYKQYQDAVLVAKANVEAAEEERLYCVLRVEMAPEIPTVLLEVLGLLDLTVVAAIQRFVKNDRYVKVEFRQRATEILGAHARGRQYTPPSRQIGDAVQPDNLPRVRQGVIKIDPNGDVTYHSVDALRDAQADGLLIDDSAIEAQQAFEDSIDEIWNAPYVPPPPPPLVKTSLTHTSKEDSEDSTWVHAAAHDIQKASQAERTAARLKYFESRRKEWE